MSKEVNIGLIGYGVVGSGVMEFLKKHRKDVEARAGARLKVKWIGSRSPKRSQWIPKGTKQTTNWKKIVHDPEVDVVVELIGGIRPAIDIVQGALSAGKHVVTANKAILANHWNEIFRLADREKKLVYFEASVMAGVPVIQALNEGLAGNRIKKMVGILNGTTNYALTRMQEEGLTFKEAINEAKKAGFAEANPKFDVEGIDSAQKIAILGSLAFGQWVNPDKVFCEGISGLHAEDIQLLETRYQSSVKLLAIAEDTKKGWIFRVHPAIISRKNPFATVRNEYNAVSFEGDGVDDVLLYGKGAGRYPTSSAVVSDLIFISRQVATGTIAHLPYVNHQDTHALKLASMPNLESRYYLRVNTADHPGVLSRVTGVLGRHSVSIQSIHQDMGKISMGRAVPIVLVTHLTKESNLQAAVRDLAKMKETVEKPVVLRFV